MFEYYDKVSSCENAFNQIKVIPQPMKQERNKLYVISVCMVLVLTTIIAYEPVRHNDFVTYDDDTYVTENPNVNKGISRESILWAFTTLHASNWHPLTWISHMLDCELFGLNPFWHHLTNLLLHIANTIMLFWILKKISGAIWPSAFVAAAFALHPLHVESVAWIAERKDVLSVFFWMLTMIAYVRYAERPDIGRYLLVVLAFCLGLLSKPMLVTLPFVLLLLDYWPLERLQLSQPKKDKIYSKSKSAKSSYQSAPWWLLIMEKIPLLVLSVVSSIITLIAQQKPMAPLEMAPLGFRISNALLSYISYVGKIFYPSHLAVLYPLNRIPSWQGVVCFTILFAISMLVVVSRRGYLIVGWLWYLGTLVPVIGIVQVGLQSMADRYTYLPSIGIFLIAAWGSEEIFSKIRYSRAILTSGAAAVLIVMVLMTRTQLGYWKDKFTLYERAIAVTENNSVMLNNLAWLLATVGDTSSQDANKAIKFAERACELTTYNQPDLLDTLAAAYAAGGNFPMAIKTAEKALKLAEDVNEEDLVKSIRERLNLYKSNQSYRKK
jgi:hypothetical protein